jgi:hypothetical protein
VIFFLFVNKKENRRKMRPVETLPEIQKRMTKGE